MYLITLPSATTSLAMIAEWSDPLFSSYWNVVMFILALSIVGWLVSIIIGKFHH